MCPARGTGHFASTAVTMLNGNSGYSNGNSYTTDDRKIRTMPWLFRIHVPGWRETR